MLIKENETKQNDDAKDIIPSAPECSLTHCYTLFSQMKCHCWRQRVKTGSFIHLDIRYLYFTVRTRAVFEIISRLFNFRRGR